MRLTLLSLAAAAALAACSEQAPPAAPDLPATPAQPAAPAAPTEPPLPDAPAAPEPADACGAAERQAWIGRNRSDLPSPPPGANWRVFETGQPVTQDLRPDRLNIEIDPDSQKVVGLSCG